MLSVSASDPLVNGVPRRRFAVSSVQSFCLGDTDALSRGAHANLAEGQFDAAFALADRRCRILVPNAGDLFLRALAHRGAGRLAAAQRDLAAALALDPTDAAVDAAALDWGDVVSQMRAAERVADRPGASWSMRRLAVAILLRGGVEIVHRLRRGPEGVHGCIAWNGPEPLQIETAGDAEPQTFDLAPDPDHPLSLDGIAAAGVAIAMPGVEMLALKTAHGSVVAVAPPPHSRPRPTPAPAPRAREVGAPAHLTIVAPVYEDYEATRACLESLAASQPGCAHRIVVIDDASPNAKLKSWLDEAAAAGAFQLIRNARNLGFAASVNLALSQRTHGDALLLNADCLLPPGAVDRLRALAGSAPDIGTLTPFSNNGELTSYPLRNAANPMPSAAEVAALDLAAREANGDALVDLPNGVGFCLYITEACLDALGGLPEIYAEGYYEDVEFCLAARERGFRNVAAPGVFVGHAGSKSFADRKAALVARNLKLIEARFPGYRLETAAFVALDPLAPYRAALDLARPPKGPAVLVACGPGVAAAPCRRRAEALAAENRDATVLTLIADARGRLSVSAIGGGAPQSLVFEDDGAAAFGAYLAKLDVARIEWRDPAGWPDAAFAALVDHGAPIELACGELTGFAPPPAPLEGPCLAPGRAAPCERCRAQLDAAPNEADRRRLIRLGRALERAERVVPLDRMAEGFAERVFKSRAARFEGRAPSTAAPRPGPIRRLGALYPQRTPAAERLLLRLGRRLAREACELLVFGAALDDQALMATGAVFVTGRVAPEDLADLAQCHGVDALLSPDRCGGYGDLADAVAELAGPGAYFDWSFGALVPASGDLSLDPRICDDKAVEEIVGWMNEERPS